MTSEPAHDLTNRLVFELNGFHVHLNKFCFQLKLCQLVYRKSLSPRLTRSSFDDPEFLGNLVCYLYRLVVNTSALQVVQQTFS